MHITRDTFTIRPTHDADREAILAVYRQCEDFLALGPVPTASAEMVRADLRLSADHGGVFCGIYDPQGVMVGVIDVIPDGYEGEAHTGYLSLLMIARPYRSGGLGGRVVCAVEGELAQRHGVTTMRAGVQVNNPGAIRFWQRMGYAIVSDPELLPDGTTCVRLHKKL